MSYNYYEDQLNSLLPIDPQYGMAIQVRANGNGYHTKWMELNEESKKALVKFLELNKKILTHLQERIDQYKEDFHQFLGEKKDKLDPDVAKALFGEKDEIILLIGSSTPYVSQILEHRLNDRNPFDDIELCKEIMGDLELEGEELDFFKIREGQIEEVVAIYNLLNMPEKVEEVSNLLY